MLLGGGRCYRNSHTDLDCYTFGFVNKYLGYVVMCNATKGDMGWSYSCKDTISGRPVVISVHSLHSSKEGGTSQDRQLWYLVCCPCAEILSGSQDWGLTTKVKRRLFGLLVATM